MFAMTHALRHTTAIVSTAALLALAAPSLAQDAMSSSSMMSGDAMGSSPMMSTNAMSTDAMASPMAAGDAMMSNDMAMANDSSAMGDPMMAGGKTIKITVKDVLTGQPFSPTYAESRTAASAPLFTLGDKASDALVAVAEGGNIGMFSVGAAMNKESAIGDAQLAIHTLPGQTRTFFVHVDEKHPLIDAVWMLGNTNDGFSGFAGFDGYKLDGSASLDVRGYDAGSEKNNEKKGFLGALGGGNDRDPENGVITYHSGIRGDADAPKAWNWDVAGPVAHVTFEVVK
jgi:pentapeptide MXKDX repeat protein